MIVYFKNRKRRKHAAQTLYATLVQQARTPLFYAEKGVPDTFNGRFEAVILHAFLVWHRLCAEGREGRLLSQALFDVMFHDMNQALRIVGIGDLGVPHHVKRMMKAYKGRSYAYLIALQDESGAAMQDALRRNLFGTAGDADDAHVTFFDTYVRAQIEALSRQDGASLLQGHVSFDAPRSSAPTVGDMAA